MTGILTVTLNPALDLFVTTPQVRPTEKLRCSAPLLHPGGGGINVARVLARLDADVLALYPAGGAAGDQLDALLAGEGVPAQRIRTAEATRQNWSVHATDTGLDWRFVLPGPTLSAAEWQACLNAAAATEVRSGMAVASGSLPPGVPLDFYLRLAHRLAVRGVRLCVDCAGPALAHALNGGVHLVKPSLHELSEFAGTPLATAGEQLAACRRIVDAGQAAIVALTLGAAGALLVTAREAWRADALVVPVASTIGAGDSFLAGLVLSLARGASCDAALAQAVATSAAALLTSGTALCRPEDVRRLLPQVHVRPLH